MIGAMWWTGREPPVPGSVIRVSLFFADRA